MSNFSHHGSEKKVYVEKMFNDISKRYDFFNTVSSVELMFSGENSFVESLFWGLIPSSS